jgi:hypothetical protein
MHTDLEHGQSLARLLRALPQDHTQPYGWDEFRRRAAPRPTLTAHLASGRALAATVAVAVAACALALRVGGFAHLPQAAPGAVHYGVARQEPAPPPADETPAERYLASLPREPAVVHVGTRAAVATLEDDIAQVDDMVSAARGGSTPPARLQALLDERTQLVSSLVQVRYAESLAYASR